MGMWSETPRHKRTLRAVLLADRAHIIAELALHFAPGIDISHVFAAMASHAHAHPDLYEYVRLTPPALLVWLAREFHLAGEAFSSPMTCFDTRSLSTRISPTCLCSSAVSRYTPGTKPGIQSRSRTSSRFTDPTSFPHSVLVSLDFSSATRTTVCPAAVVS